MYFTRARACDDRLHSCPLVKSNQFTGATRNATGQASLLGMAYNPANGLVYGLGLGGGTRTVLKLDPETLAAPTVVGPVHGFGIAGGCLAAIDPVAQSIYWLAMKQPCVPHTKFYLVANSLADGALISASEAVCGGPPCDWLNCPRSLAFYQAP